MKTIALDTEGTDLGFASVLEGCIQFVDKHDGIAIRAYILEENLESAKSIIESRDRIELITCEKAASVHTEVRSLMSEVLHSLRNGRQIPYSMGRALYDTIQQGADACLIPGHIGHAIFLARTIEKHLGIFMNNASQCLMTIINHGRIMLDLGGLIDQDLLKLAVIGELFSRCCLGNENPKVGFLNIGTEANKGRPDVQEAAVKFKKYKPESSFGENGFIEANGIESEVGCHVIVADGFVGNIALKVMEGVLRSAARVIKQAISDADPEKRPILSEFASKAIKTFNVDSYNAAILCGFQALILKCHGGSDSGRICNALEYTCNLMPHFPAFREAFAGFKWTSLDEL